jgi:PAS domain S-box-containing protein
MFGSEKGAGLFASVSIRNLTFGLVAFTLLFGATLFVLTWRTFDLSRVSDDLWSEYYSTSNQEVRSVSGVVSALGYGGMIHNFKDFLLRKDQRRSTETQRRIGALTETLDQLALIDVSAEERQAIGLLRDTVATYGDRLRSARILVAENKSAAQIDAQVRYDDGPAIDAINLLVERVQSDAAAVSSDLYPPVQLLTLQHTLGYGGVIHQFKNHVLRRDDQTQNNFWDAVARAQDEITKYRSLKITGEERRALDVIETMVSAYSRRMEQVAEMNASDMTAEQTDDVVAYNDGPVLAAISVLERALNSRSAQVAQALSKQLAATERLSLWALAGAVVLSLFLSAGILSALRSAVVVPSGRIAEGLEKLAEGDTDVDLSDLEADTEIGAIARAAGVFRDRSIELVTLREEMLNDSRAQTKSIVDAAADAILSTDGFGRVESANPAAADLFRAETEVLIGKNISDLLDLPAARANESALEAFMHWESEAKQRGEVEAKRVDGTEFTAKLALGKVQLRDRLVYTAIVADLTEAKKVERMKSEFVSTVSHELRAPLTSIKGSLGLLKASVLGDISTQARSMIDIAYNNCDRLVRLINDILDVEKIEAGKLSFEFEPVKIAQQIEEVIKDTSGFASGLGVSVIAKEIPEGLRIEADPDRLAQVLTNLVSNAVKFSRKGDVVTLDAEVVGEDRLRVTVTDHGLGITDEFQKRKEFSRNSPRTMRRTHARLGGPASV